MLMKASCQAVSSLITCKSPFPVLHISDTHLTAVGTDENAKKHQLNRLRTLTFGGRQEEALRDSIAWAKEPCDCLVHTGDLIDWQSEANFALVKKYFGEGMTGCLGNHEYSTDMWLSDLSIRRLPAVHGRERRQFRDDG